MRIFSFSLLVFLFNCGGPDYSSYVPQSRIEFEPTYINVKPPRKHKEGIENKEDAMKVCVQK